MKREYIFAGISVLCWGTLATVSKLLVGSMDTMFAMAYSFLFAALFLAVYNWRMGNLPEIIRLPLSVWLRMILVGSCGVFIYNYFLLKGMERLPAQEAFVINYLWPAMIIILSCVILRERMTLGKMAAVACSFLGIVVITTEGSLAGLIEGSVSGILFCLLAALSYGMYSVLNKREEYNKNISVMIAYASGAVFAFGLLAVGGKMGVPDGEQTAGLLFNGIICNGIPYLTWAFAMDMGNTAVISNLAYLTPFISLLFTHFILGEEITVYSVGGLLLIVLGIILQMLVQKKQKKK